MKKRKIAFKVNRRMNDMISYRKDRVDGRGDNWKLPEFTLEDRYGDCEDIAIAKAYWLIEQEGLRYDDVRIAKCRNEVGMHVVCLVKDFARPCLFAAKRPVTWVLDINKPYFVRQDKSALEWVDEMSYGEAIQFCNFDRAIRYEEGL